MYWIRSFMCKWTHLNEAFMAAKMTWVTVRASRFGAWGLTTNTGNRPPIQKGTPTAMHRCLITGSSCALENKACVLITAESNVNNYCLINNASLYKSVLLLVYNPGKQNNVLFVNCNLYYCLFKINKKILSIDLVFPVVTKSYRTEIRTQPWHRCIVPNIFIWFNNSEFWSIVDISSLSLSLSLHIFIKSMFYWNLNCRFTIFFIFVD